MFSLDSLTVRSFLSDDRAFTFDLTSMVDVPDCPSSLICISISCCLSTDWVISCACESCWEDMSNSFSWSLLKGMFSSDHFRVSLTASASSFICVLARSLWSAACLLASSCMHWATSEKWPGVNTQHLWPKKLFLILPLLSQPSNLVAFINVCSKQMSHQLVSAMDCVCATICAYSML